MVRGDRDAAVAHHLLEQVLVHRERRRRDAGADVGDVRELEQPLHRPVLAERPVQDREDDVDGAESSRASRPRPGRAASPPDRLGAWHQDVSEASLRAPSGRRGRSRPRRSSYRSGSSAAATERADAREISCSLERPPARMATRRRRAGRQRVVVVVVVGGGGGPGECWPTTIVTVEPCAAWALPAGFCDWTMSSWLASVAVVLLDDLEAGGLERAHRLLRGVADDVRHGDLRRAVRDVELHARALRLRRAGRGALADDLALRCRCCRRTIGFEVEARLR